MKHCYLSKKKKKNPFRYTHAHNLILSEPREGRRRRKKKLTWRMFAKKLDRCLMIQFADERST